MIVALLWYAHTHNSAVTIKLLMADETLPNLLLCRW